MFKIGDKVDIVGWKGWMEDFVPTSKGLTVMRVDDKEGGVFLKAQQSDKLGVWVYSSRVRKSKTNIILENK